MHRPRRQKPVLGTTNARKTRLWHGPEFLSLVADCHPPRPAVGGECPGRARGHRQPRALGLGGAGRRAAGGQPDGRPRRSVERKPAAIPDIGGYGNQEYGNRVGVFRIFAVLDKYGIRPTLALDKAVAENYPVLVEEGRKRGGNLLGMGCPAAASSISTCRKTRNANTSAPRSRRSNRPPARAPWDGAGRIFRRRRTRRTCLRPRAFAMSAIGATTSSLTR